MQVYTPFEYSGEENKDNYKVCNSTVRIKHEIIVQKEDKQFGEG